MRSRGGLPLAGALALALASACVGEGEPQPGFVDPCRTPQAPLLGCPPPTVGEQPFTIEDACRKLVDCGVLALDAPESNADFVGCVHRLRGDEYTADRLEFVLRCTEVATCQDLRPQNSNPFSNPCFAFGDEPPE